MAAELEKLAKDLKIAGYGDGSVILDSVVRSLRRINLIPGRLYNIEQVAIPQKEGAKVLTTELASLINTKCGAQLGDDVEIRSLSNWEDDRTTPPIWRDVILNCSDKQRSSIRKVLNGLFGHGNAYLTIGEVRQADPEHLFTHCYYIGPISLRFIRSAFKKDLARTE